MGRVARPGATKRAAPAGNGGRGPGSRTGDQSPFSSTRSTVAAGAEIVARPERPGPIPRAGTVTRGAPEELPALTVRLATEKGRRFSTRRVVLLADRRATLDVTNAEPTAWSMARAIEAASMAEGA